LKQRHLKLVCCRDDDESRKPLVFS